MLSRSQIDKSGKYLSNPLDDFDAQYLDTYISLEGVFDEYRESHLAPLTSFTAKLQQAFAGSVKDYYVAQRLKRKPQILRKLSRLSVRLSQLQDIGGLRVVVSGNHDVSDISNIVDRVAADDNEYNLLRTVDYRGSGRDDSGYRAAHKILKYRQIYLELQIRSHAQHHWAESVERTSVFYGKRLKEGEGDFEVKHYFRQLSNAYKVLEDGYKFSSVGRIDLEHARVKAVEVIERDGLSHLNHTSVNEDVIKTLIQKGHSNKNELTNWILVFDWNTAQFVTWQMASRKPEEAVAEYVRYEKQYPESGKYEVVLVGSSDISTLRRTHSHYFGISKPDGILEQLGSYVPSMSAGSEIDNGAKILLAKMVKRKIWGMSSGVQRQTLHKHFCPEVTTFEASLQLLIERGLVIDKRGAGVTLNMDKSVEIEEYI